MPDAPGLAAAATQSPLRAAITAAHRLAEPACLPGLIEAARLPPARARAAQARARALVETLRAAPKVAGVEALIREYALSTEEGVALMCLAEALLRIPDAATRDALIRDKIGPGDWAAHLGASPSLFVNAATWGLLITGRLTGAAEASLLGGLKSLAARAGEPVIRKAVDLAMRLMGEQFVLGETISQALARAGRREAQGFRHSYDMLGEAALTAADAARYLSAYADAIGAIGAASKARGIYEGPGISIKLSALHPRYGRAQRARVMAELLPRLTELTRLARAQNIGLNIDAEESERLDLSLDLLEALCANSEFEGFDGIGFVVQAYQKRAPAVLDFCIDLARRTRHRLMLRLVKGAYWDAEIKRAQIDGLEDFPVFTRKIHTDMSYLACARRMLAAGAAIYPQFATHNALSLATIHEAAAPDADYEFQCLHGMGEGLYAHVVGPQNMGRPCRIYAPVGTHETLLAYLVRRLLENGANSSFVNRIADPAVSIDELLRDPIEEALRLTPVGRPHDAIKRPPEMFLDRTNSAGLDFANEESIAAAEAFPDIAIPGMEPADEAAIDAAFTAGRAAFPAWAATPPAARAAILERAAVFLEDRRATLTAALVREAFKTLPNAIAEIREAVDFLRYYAAQARGFDNALHIPLGVAVCISPWNFPLAIFTGQLAAALAAGNVAIAKPAEETPFIARLAVGALHDAGLPRDALHFIPGAGEAGATLVADARADAVIFTGSTDVARHIQRALSQRLSPAGKPVPLIAETGGQNAMIVDSSALPEQAVADIIVSAFDSAGQRCSALRLLCIQAEAAPRLLAMLTGAMAELTLGDPGQLATDIGPVISAPAAANIRAYIAAMRAAGHRVTQLHPDDAATNIVPPTLIEIPSVAALGAEIFGPVLHVLTYRRAELDGLLEAINATGYGLTFGLHTRIDATIAHVTGKIRAGNIYINRNIVGAAVGVQPFGGHGLSGTGPKAGGPLYLRRLLRAAPRGLPAQGELPGPVGERNDYALLPRGRVLCVHQTPAGAAAQRAALAGAGQMVLSPDEAFEAVLLEGGAEETLAMAARLAARPGPIIPLLALSPAETAAGIAYDPAWLLTERVISENTAAAGGNASLMTLA